MKKAITYLVIPIITLAFIATIIGIFSNAENLNLDSFKSIYGDEIKLYGKGIYQRDSVSVASQAIAQDYVTLFLGIPVLIIGLVLFHKDDIKGKLLLTGTLGYFLYTYTSYAFLSMYNSLFLIDVALMSLSLYAFILSFMSIDVSEVKQAYKDRFPLSLISYFMIIFAVFMGLMWLGLVVNPLISGTKPDGLEHYTTLVIQALDLGIVVPTSILAGILLLKRKPFGYVLAPIMVIKGMTMLTAMSAMVINQLAHDTKVSLAFIIAVPIANLFTIYMVYLIFKNIKEKRNV